MTCPKNFRHECDYAPPSAMGDPYFWCVSIASVDTRDESRGVTEGSWNTHTMHSIARKDDPEAFRSSMGFTIGPPPRCLWSSACLSFTSSKRRMLPSRLQRTKRSELDLMATMMRDPSPAAGVWACPTWRLRSGHFGQKSIFARMIRESHRSCRDPSYHLGIFYLERTQLRLMMYKSGREVLLTKSSSLLWKRGQALNFPWRAGSCI